MLGSAFDLSKEIAAIAAAREKKTGPVSGEPGVTDFDRKFRDSLGMPAGIDVGDLWAPRGKRKRRNKG